MNTLFNSVKHFFIPTKENEYRAGSLQIHMLSTYLVVAIVLVFVSKNTTLFANVLGVATDITVQALETDTNAVRTQAGLKPLALNDELSAAATKKAANMFQENYWAHFGPNGESPWDFIKQSGYQYEFAGENLAKNFLFSRNVVDAWMNSPTHRENVLRKEYTDVGYAVVNGMLNGEETTLVVQMFGTPLVKTVEARPVTSLPEKVAPHLAKTAPAVQPTSTHLAYNINLIFVAFIVIAVILDLIFAAKLDILHMRSKHIAHLIFLGFIGLALLMLFKNGAIM